ncbi:GlcG/HbpS family heme-binding protein [Acinetobacter pittii]|uniref:GlcG/HbpS family heme-binding protein n=1 Tax=Acinetobacter pittii TaxID=48296 RepID=UPI0023402A46|nr:heme-binding protein [Acinetobacter pittii]MDC4554031.1 heme-binding protein [Acinetobacter baumannii]
MIGFEQSFELIHCAIKVAREEQFKPMAIVVVDTSGNIVCSGRDNGANFMRHEIAYGKAVAAIGMQTNTRQLVKKSQDMPVFFNSIATAIDKPFIPQTGAILICKEDDVIGAIGASGGTGDQDEMILVKAIEHLKLSWK